MFSLCLSFIYLPLTRSLTLILLSLTHLSFCLSACLSLFHLSSSLSYTQLIFLSHTHSHSNLSRLLYLHLSFFFLSLSLHFSRRGHLVYRIHISLSLDILGVHGSQMFIMECLTAGTRRAPRICTIAPPSPANDGHRTYAETHPASSLGDRWRHTCELQIFS